MKKACMKDAYMVWYSQSLFLVFLSVRKAIRNRWQLSQQLRIFSIQNAFVKALLSRCQHQLACNLPGLRVGVLGWPSYNLRWQTKTRSVLRQGRWGYYLLLVNVFVKDWYDLIVRCYMICYASGYHRPCKERWNIINVETAPAWVWDTHLQLPTETTN